MWMLTDIQGCLSASCAVIRLCGFTVNIWLIKFLASDVTVSHSGYGYWGMKLILVIILSMFKGTILRHKCQPWFVRTICVDPHPRTEDSRREGCRVWHRMPKCLLACRTAPSSRLPVTSSQAFRQIQTMPAVRLAPQSPVQSQPAVHW